MSLYERIYGKKETAGKPAVSSGNQQNLYTAASEKSYLAPRIAAKNAEQETLYADAVNGQGRLARRIAANGGQVNLYADAAAKLKGQSGNAARGTSKVFGSAYDKADDRTSSLYSGKYAGILGAGDYAELSKSAGSKRQLFGDARYDYINDINGFRKQSDAQQAAGRGSDYGKYAFMTDDEVGVYNYLYATQGKKAANDYLSDIEPELDKQWYTGTNRVTTEALGKNTATRALASAATVAAQPARTITSLIALGEDAVRMAKGQDINPYSKWRQASNITQDLRSDTSAHIEETNPGFGGKVGSFVYNTVMSAADSAMNSLAASGAAQGLKLTGDSLMRATNMLGAGLMSSEAASQAVAEGKEKGYSNMGAFALGLTRGAVEYASEALGGEWVIKNIKANPMNFVKSMALNMIPEGTEEVMSDVMNEAINLMIDAAFGTEESGITETLRHYRENGTPWQKEHAELMTVIALLGQEGLSFLGGALATVGSSAVQTYNMRTGITETARRLNTSTEEVVRLMDDIHTEDPGTVYALAELTDADSAQELRERAGIGAENGSAARFDVQEGNNYTAKGENTPAGDYRAQNEANLKPQGAAINIQEDMNHGQSAYSGREDGTADIRTGGEAAAAEGGREETLAGGREEIRRGVGESAEADLREVTPAQLGIRSGGTESVTLVDAQKLGGNAQRAYNLVANNGMEPVAVRGAIQVGNGYANAYVENGKVYFRVDAVDAAGNAISPEALAKHELFHNYVSEEVIQAADDVIRESMSAEEFDAMKAAYREAYAKIYDLESMSEAEIERLLTEEIAADAYAGLNWFSESTPVQEAVRAEASRNAPAQRAEAQQRKTGPPGKATAAGIKARTANSENLRRAEAMEQSGTDNETIRQETGWYRGMDGQWRFEIDDSNMEFRKNGDAQLMKEDGYRRLSELTDKWDKAFENGNDLSEAEMQEMERLQEEYKDAVWEEKYRLRDFIKHDELFKAYPALNRVSLVFDSLPDGAKGYFSKRDNTIVLSDSLFGKEADVVLHEIQHVIQKTEGFTGGASPKYWNDRMEEGFSKRRATGEEMMPSELYRNTAGEIEARDTASRRRMTAEERKKTPPNLGDADTVFADGNGISAYVDVDADGNPVTVIKTAENLFDKAPKGAYANIAKKLIMSEYAGKTLPLGENDLARITKESGGEYGYPSNQLPTNSAEYNAKMRASAELHNLLENSTYDHWARDMKNHKEATLGFDYYKTVFIVDGKVFEGLINIANSENGRVFYDITNIKEASDYTRKYAAPLARSSSTFGNLSAATIRQTEGNSQGKSSGRASVEVENRAANNENAQETDAEWEERRERWKKWREEDRKEAERLRRRDGTLAQANRENGHPAPDKGAGQVYRELMADGRSEIAAPISMDNPKTTVYKVRLESDGLGGYHTATVEYGGHRIYSDVGALKEVVARNAAEYADAMANKNFSEENNKRAKRLEAEKTSDEDARIAELFGNTEELNTAETAESAEDAAGEETVEATAKKVTTEAVKAEKNFREDFEKITGGAMRMFVNAGDTVRRIAKATGNKSLEGYYFNAGAYSQRAGNWITKGGARTDINGYKIGESLADVLAPMRKDEKTYRDFQLYLLHMHNVDRMMYDNTGELNRIKENLRWVKEKYPQLKELSHDELYRIAQGDSGSPIVKEAAHEIYIAAHEGKRPDVSSVVEGAAYALELERQRAIVQKQGLKPVFGYDVTADDSRTAAQLLEAKNPEFKEWAKEVYKYSDDLIQYRVQAGLITREFADALKKRYPHYIPTFREEGTNSKRARSARRNGGIVISNAIGRAVGSDGVLLPLHTALSRKTVSTMRNAGLNQFGLALMHEYDGNKKATEKYIQNVAESEYTPTEASIESDEDYRPVFENVFSVKENGKAYDITMDEGLTTAMKAFEPDKYANLDVAKALKKGNDLFKALCTGYNPLFMARNLVRDAQDAAFYSTDSATWAKMFLPAWKQIVKNGEIWQQYKALGGSYASMLDYTTGMVKEPKNALGKAAAKYESLGQAIEAAPRLAEFMTILANKAESKTVDGVKSGKFTQSDLMEAMLGAADITTNFARGGTVTKMLNRYLVPFLNPSVQGADKFVRNLTERKGFKAWASLAIKAAALGILPTLLNALCWKDDDEWDDIPDQTKANYYLFKLGNGYWLKIPRGRALTVFSTGTVYGTEKAEGDNPKFSDVIEVIKSNVAPTDIFNQNIATAWTQTKLFNPDNPGTTWYGGNIESERLQNYRPSERYDEKTDEISKALGKAFGLSPKKINYLLDQYSGVIGDLLLPRFTDAATASTPLLAPLEQAFILDTTSSNKATGEYYDLLDDLKYDANDGDVGAGITRKYVSHAGDEVNDYYQQIRAIQSDENLTKAEKNRLVRALKNRLIETQKEIIEKQEPYREAVDAYLKAHPELATDNAAAVAEYAEANDITEDQAESRMDAIVYRECNRKIFGAEYALKTYNADVYDKARAAYAEGVSYDTYYEFYFATKDMHADKDENGKSISGSKKKKVVEYINSLDIPPEQKDALYIAAGYTEKSARYQKWNGGSGGSGGGSGKQKAVKAPKLQTAKMVIPEAKVSTSSPKASGTDAAAIRKEAQKTVDTAIKVGNRTVRIEAGSPLDYFLKYGKLPSTKK